MYLEKKLKYGILYIKVGNERIYVIMTCEFFWSILASIIKKPTLQQPSKIKGSKSERSSQLIRTYTDRTGTNERSLKLTQIKMSMSKSFS